MKSKFVDRDGRNSARLLIRKWLDGKITNYEVDDGWPWDSYDEGVVDIGNETWTYFERQAGADEPLLSQLPIPKFIPQRWPPRGSF